MNASTNNTFVIENLETRRLMSSTLIPQNDLGGGERTMELTGPVVIATHNGSINEDSGPVVVADSTASGF